MRSTSSHSQQRLFRGEVLSLLRRLFSHSRMPQIRRLSYGGGYKSKVLTDKQRETLQKEKAFYNS